jgi:hypothetical protein
MRLSVNSKTRTVVMTSMGFVLNYPKLSTLVRVFETIENYFDLP